MATKVFLDANVILDFVLKRNKYEMVRSIFMLEEQQKIKLFVSSSILHIISYWLTKNLGSTVAKTTLLKFLDHIKVVEGNHESSVKALESNFTDIEDALQYFTALLNKMDYVVSFDKGFQKFNSDKLQIIDAQTLVSLFKL
ncbi:MAG TPA: PIN domain-containing protein [Pelobium sp.]|nr:PIN domain-containing protein [Pelobium sp.]